MDGRLVSRLSAGLFASVFLVSVPAIAEDDEEALPVPHTLSCVTACAKFTPAEYINKPIRSYPSYDTGFYGPYVEGFVSLQYKVSAEGKVDDVVILHLLGPQEFADRAVSAIKKWTFKPATRDGQPVAQCRNMKFVFRMPGEPAGARDEIIRAYRSAVGLIKEGKFDDARGVLVEAQARPRLNFYERGMLAYLTAQVALKKNDLLAMRAAVEIPTEFNMDKLTPTVARDLWRLRTLSSLYLGDLVDAASSLENMKKVRGFAPADSIVKLVEDGRVAIDAKPQYAMRAHAASRLSWNPRYPPRRNGRFRKAGATVLCLCAERQARLSMSCRRQDEGARRQARPDGRLCLQLKSRV